MSFTMSRIFGSLGQFHSKDELFLRENYETIIKKDKYECECALLRSPTVG